MSTKKTKTKKKTATPKTKKRTVKRATKTATKAKKTATKKKTVAKKKSLSKKTVKKKASAKKTTRKKAVSITPARKPIHSSSAHQVHSRMEEPSIKSHDPVRQATSLDLSERFSFQHALNQVREKVASDPGHTTPDLSKPKTSHVELRPDVKPNQVLSPYVLDLKSKKTVVQAHHAAFQPKQVRLNAPQLSLFEEEPQSLNDKMHERANKFVQHFSSTKKTNLIQVQQRNNLGILGRRIRRSISSLFALPGHRRLEKQRRQTLKMNLNFTKPASEKRTIPLIVKTTRSGESIPVAKVSGTIKRAKDVFSHGSSLVNLSSLLEKRKKRSLASELFEGMSFQKAFMPFATLCLMLLLPFAGASLYDSLTSTQMQVFGAADKAVNTLQEATVQVQSFEFAEASDDFEEASQIFLSASALLENNQGFVTNLLSVVPVLGNKIQAGESLLSIGDQLATSATLFSQGVAVLSEEDHFLADQPLSAKLEYFFVRMDEATPYIESASAELAQIDPNDLPEDIRPKIELLQQTLPIFEDQLTRVNELSDPLLTFLGHESLKRYLIMFQNNTELRATGGFMGSMALVDLDRAEIEDIEIPGGGPYDYQGSLYESYKAPRALQLLNPKLELQDANWFYDWPSSADTIATLYEKAGGPTVDGVIAINTNVLESLLEFVGPVNLPSYDKEFTVENFRDVLQTHVEFEYDEELNQPKKIIADLAPVLLDEIKDLEPSRYLELATQLTTLLQEKDILISHQDESLQSVFSELGWSGEVIETDRDYLSIVHTNLAGGKTDSVMQDEYDLSTHLNENGEVEHTLTVRRTHTGQKGTPLLGVRNVNYMRVFVPEGSELLSASGFTKPPLDLFESPEDNWTELPLLASGDFTYSIDEETGVEVYSESGKTVFADWVQTDPGQTSEVKITYRVPNSVLIRYEIPARESSWTDWFTGKTAVSAQTVLGYQLILQKQSGAWDPVISMDMTYPYDWQLQASSIPSSEQLQGSWSTQALMNDDSVWSYLFY